MILSTEDIRANSSDSVQRDVALNAACGAPLRASSCCGVVSRCCVSKLSREDTGHLQGAHDNHFGPCHHSDESLS